MSVDAVYRGRRVYRVIDETSEDANIGPRLDFGDGHEPIRVDWGDPDLSVDPTDDEWDAASDDRLPVHDPWGPVPIAPPGTVPTPAPTDE